MLIESVPVGETDSLLDLGYRLLDQLQPSNTVAALVSLRLAKLSPALTQVNDCSGHVRLSFCTRHNLVNLFGRGRTLSRTYLGGVRSCILHSCVHSADGFVDQPNGCLAMLSLIMGSGLERCSGSLQCDQRRLHLGLAVVGGKRRPRHRPRP